MRSRQQWADHPKTQEAWLEHRDRLLAGEYLNVDFEDGSVVLAAKGELDPQGCDFLARWCMERAGIRPYGITAPDWSCSFSQRSDENKAGFAYWHLGGYDVIGIYVDAKRSKRDRGMWDESFIIPTMPVPVWRDWPEDWKEWSKAERRAYIEKERPGRLMLEALALWCFAHWLLANTKGSDSLGDEEE